MDGWKCRECRLFLPQKRCQRGTPATNKESTKVLTSKSNRSQTEKENYLKIGDLDEACETVVGEFLSPKPFVVHNISDPQIFVI
jgi:hypothetical protein